MKMSLHSDPAPSRRRRRQWLVGVGAAIGGLLTLVVGVPAMASVPSNATPITTDYYSYKCLSTTTSGSINSVILATCNISSNSPDLKQYWKSSSSAKYELINYSTGKCLTAQSDTGAYMSACTNSRAQQWTFSGITGTGTFQSRLNDLCLASTSSNTVTTKKCASAGTSTGWEMPVGGIW